MILENFLHYLFNYLELLTFAIIVKGVSMIESMWSSMTSSMQLAADCLKNERDNSNEGGQTFEGIESFAQTIDSSKYKIVISLDYL